MRRFGERNASRACLSMPCGKGLRVQDKAASYVSWDVGGSCLLDAGDDYRMQEKNERITQNCDVVLSIGGRGESISFMGRLEHSFGNGCKISLVVPEIR